MSRTRYENITSGSILREDDHRVGVIRVEACTCDSENITTELVELSVGGNRVNDEINIDLGDAFINRNQATLIIDSHVP